MYHIFTYLSSYVLIYFRIFFISASAYEFVHFKNSVFCRKPLLGKTILQTGYMIPKIKMITAFHFPIVWTTSVNHIIPHYMKALLVNLIQLRINTRVSCSFQLIVLISRSTSVPTTLTNSQHKADILGLEFTQVHSELPAQNEMKCHRQNEKQQLVNRINGNLVGGAIW